MTVEQIRKMNSFTENITNSLLDLDELVLELIDIRDKYNFTTNSWIIAHGKVTMLERYKETIVRETERLKKFI